MAFSKAPGHPVDDTVNAGSKVVAYDFSNVDLNTSQLKQALRHTDGREKQFALQRQRAKDQGFKIVFRSKRRGIGVGQDTKPIAYRQFGDTSKVKYVFD